MPSQELSTDVHNTKRQKLTLGNILTSSEHFQMTSEYFKNVTKCQEFIQNMEVSQCSISVETEEPKEAHR